VFSYRLSVEVDGDIRDRSALVVDFGPAFYENKCNCTKKNGGRHEQQWFNPFWRVDCHVIHKRKLFPYKTDLIKQQTQYMPTALHKKSNRQHAEIKATLQSIFIYPEKHTLIHYSFIEEYSETKC
jgi:hypothetical protein